MELNITGNLTELEQMIS